MPLSRAHCLLRRLLQILTAQYRRREPTCPVRFHPARVPGTLSRTETRASCAVPLGHGLSPAKGTRAPSAVPLGGGINSVTGYALLAPPSSTMAGEAALHVLKRGFRSLGYTFDDRNTRSVCRSPRPWSKQAKGTRASSAVPLSRGINSATGYVFLALPPSTMAREPALHAPLPPATPRGAMGLLLQCVVPLSERVHPSSP